MTESAPHFEVHIDIDRGGDSPVAYLAGVCDLSRQQIKQAMHKGAVWLARHGKPRRLRRATRALRTGDRLHLYYDADVLAQRPPPARLIADELAYSVWFKPGGMTLQGSKWGDHCTITRWAEQQLHPERPAFIVHRLDRAASGLLLLAHQKKTAAALAQLFRQRAVQKHYRATVEGEFPAAPVTVDAPIEGRNALSRVRRLAFHAARNRSLLEVDIETGRKHQIRRHLAGLGFAIVGDRLYGSRIISEDLQLTACSLSFQCPLSHTVKNFVLPSPLTPVL